MEGSPGHPGFGFPTAIPIPVEVSNAPQVVRAAAQGRTVISFEHNGTVHFREVPIFEPTLVVSSDNGGAHAPWGWPTPYTQSDTYTSTAGMYHQAPHAVMYNQAPTQAWDSMVGAARASLVPQEAAELYPQPVSTLPTSEFHTELYPLPASTGAVLESASPPAVTSVSLPEAAEAQQEVTQHHTLPDVLDAGEAAEEVLTANEGVQAAGAPLQAPTEVVQVGWGRKPNAPQKKYGLRETAARKRQHEAVAALEQAEPLEKPRKRGRPRKEKPEVPPKKWHPPKYTQPRETDEAEIRGRSPGRGKKPKTHGAETTATESEDEAELLQILDELDRDEAKALPESIQKEKLRRYEDLHRVKAGDPRWKKRTDKLSVSDVIEMHFGFVGTAVSMEEVPKLGGLIHTVAMKITDLYRVPDPEERMKRVFQIIIDKTLDEAEKRFGKRPKSFAMRVDHARYDHTNPAKGAIGIPRSGLNMNPATEVHNMFQHVEQSANILNFAEIPLHIQVDVYEREAAADDLFGRGRPNLQFVDLEAEASSGASADEDSLDAADFFADMSMIDDSERPDEVYPNPYLSDELFPDESLSSSAELSPANRPGPSKRRHSASPEAATRNNKRHASEYRTSTEDTRKPQSQDVTVLDSDGETPPQLGSAPRGPSVIDIITIDSDSEQRGCPLPSTPPPRPVKQTRPVKRCTGIYGRNSVFRMDNIDNLCLFRSLVVALMWTRRRYIDFDGNEKPFLSNDTDKKFRRFVESQYTPPVVQDKVVWLKEAVALLNDVQPGLGSQVKAKVNAAQASGEVSKAQDLLKANGIDHPLPQYSPTRDRVLKFARRMMREMNVPEDLDGYSLRDYHVDVQRWLDSTYGDSAYRLVVFKESVDKKDKNPRLITNVSRPLEAKSIYLGIDSTEKHFFPIRCVQSYLDERFYCPFCAKIFHRKEYHALHCPVLCAKCCRATRQECKTANADFPPRVCSDEPGKKGCNRTFYTQECFDEHLKVMCQKFMYCPMCGYTDLNNGKHECGVFLCKGCKERHRPGKQNCFITVRKPKKDTPYRVVVFDIECRLCGDVRCDGKCYDGEPCPIEKDELRQQILGIAERNDAPKTPAKPETTRPAKPVSPEQLLWLTNLEAEKQGFSRAADPVRWQGLGHDLALRLALRGRWQGAFALEDVEIAVLSRYPLNELDLLSYDDPMSSAMARQKDEQNTYRRLCVTESIRSLKQLGLYVESEDDDRSGEDTGGAESAEAGDRELAAEEPPRPPEDAGSSPSAAEEDDTTSAEDPGRSDTPATNRSCPPSDATRKRNLPHRKQTSPASSQPPPGDSDSEDPELLDFYKIDPAGVYARRRKYAREAGKSEPARKHDCAIVVSYTMCSLCIESGDSLRDVNNGCPICFGDANGRVDAGASRYRKWSVAEENTPPRPGKPTYTLTPIKGFLEYLFGGTDWRYPNVVYSHNGGKYDIILVAGVAFKIPQLKMDLIAKGNKIYQMTVSKGTNRANASVKGGVRQLITPTCFRDSINIIPVALAKFVDTLGLTEGLEPDGAPLKSKGDFPFEIAQPENYDKTFPGLPSLAHFKILMTKKEKMCFEDWHAEHRDLAYPVAQMMDSYCTSDVKILAHGLVKMRQLMQFTGVDILRDSMTVASQAVNHFRQNYLPKLPKGSFPRVHPHGYFPYDQQSKVARKWLKYQAEKVYNIPLHKFRYAEHVCSDCLGEHRVFDAANRKYMRLDGYYAEKCKWTADGYYACCVSRSKRTQKNGICVDAAWKKATKRSKSEEAPLRFSFSLGCKFRLQFAIIANKVCFVEPIQRLHNEHRVTTIGDQIRNDSRAQRSPQRTEVRHAPKYRLLATNPGVDYVPPVGTL